MTVTPGEIRELTARLDEQLAEGQHARERLVNALQANMWPELRRTSMLRSSRFTDIPDPRDFRERS